MAQPRLVSVRDFNTSTYAQLADTSTANISDVLVRAEKVIESKLQRPIYPTQFTEEIRVDSTRVYLRERPIISIDAMSRKLFPTSVGSPFTQYSLDKDMGVVNFSSYAYGYYINIVYTAGFATCPEDIKEAILKRATLMLYQDLEFYGSGDGRPHGLLYVNDEIEELLKPYKQLNTAYSRIN